MKKIILAVLVAMMANAANAQKLIVYSMMGKVEDVTSGKVRQVNLRDALSLATVLNIPYQGSVVLYDELNSQQYTLKTPGRATVKDMIADNNNSVQKLTSEYVAFIKKQISGGGQVLLRNCSDPATVTRSLAITTAPQDGSDLLLCGTDGFSDKPKDSFTDDFQKWRKQMLDDYQTFRKQMLDDYANFVRNPWQERKLLPPEEKPMDEIIEPVEIEPLKIDGNGGKPVTPDFDKMLRERTPKPAPIISILPMPQPLPTPEPVAPIKENRELKDEYRTFTFFGTEMKVRWTDDNAFKLAGLSENNIADAIAQLSDKKYDNLLYDCLQLRTNYRLSDWAYYLMLKELCNMLCGKDTNESTLLRAMLFSQSGYMSRFAKTSDKLLLMVSTQFHLYGYSYLVLDGHNFYLLEGDCDGISLCPAKFPTEQEMSLIMKESPLLTDNKSDVRTFSSLAYPQLKAEVSVNKNLLDLYSSYPSSYFNNDFMTRWAMYANKEIQPEVREQLYPQLKAIIEGKSQREKVEAILNWIQTSFEYEYDDKVWGHDRAFFAEESLFYPYCDCEDRSILFTRLVRDLVGLKCILVFYPGHLASGVCFTEDVNGDYIEVSGERFTVCDPTILGCGAPVGWTMPKMDNSTASVIVLEN